MNQTRWPLLHPALGSDGREPPIEAQRGALSRQSEFPAVNANPTVRAYAPVASSADSRQIDLCVSILPGRITPPFTEGHSNPRGQIVHPVSHPKDTPDSGRTGAGLVFRHGIEREGFLTLKLNISQLRRIASATPRF